MGAVALHRQRLSPSHEAIPSSPSMPLTLRDLDPDSTRLILSFLDPASRLSLSFASTDFQSNFRAHKISQFEYVRICAQNGYCSLLSHLVSLGVDLDEPHLLECPLAPLEARKDLFGIFLNYFDERRDHKPNIGDWSRGFARLVLSIGDLRLVEQVLERFPSHQTLFLAEVSAALLSPNPIDVIEDLNKKFDWFIFNPPNKNAIYLVEGILDHDNLFLWKHYFSDLKFEEFLLFLEKEDLSWKGTNIVTYLLDTQYPQIVESGTGTLTKDLASRFVRLGYWDGFKLLCQRIRFSSDFINNFRFDLVARFPEAELSETIRTLPTFGFTAHVNCEDPDDYAKTLFLFTEFHGYYNQKRKKMKLKGHRASEIARALEPFVSPVLYKSIDETTRHQLFLLCCMTNDLALLDFLESKGVFSWTQDRNLFLQALVKVLSAGDHVSDDAFYPLMADLKRRNILWFDVDVQVPNEGFGIYNAGFGRHPLLVHLLHCSYFKPLRIHYLLTTLDYSPDKWKEMLRASEILGMEHSFNTFAQRAILETPRYHQKALFAMLRLVFVTYGRVNFSPGFLEKYVYTDLRSHGEWTLPLIEKLKDALSPL